MRALRSLRAATYLLATGVTGLLTLLTTLLLFAAGGVLAVLVVGIPLLAALALIGVPVGGAERRFQRLVDVRPLRNGHRVPPRPGLSSWLRTRYTEAATWRALAYATLLMTVLWPIDLLAVVLGVTVPAALLVTPVQFATLGDAVQVNVLKTYQVTSWGQAVLAGLAGVVALVACAFGIGLLARLRAVLARAILTLPEDRLKERVVELARSRVRLVDAFEAERSRIERDLHDGAQQRLVALSMMLGLARLDAPAGPLADQLSRAHDEAGRALVELRDLIRGIHPPLLTDFGLEAAVTDLATRCAVRVDVGFAVAARFSRTVESTAYFVVSEALANLAKHSGADRGEITGGYAGGTLTVEVSDNGRGGAELNTGTGLIGLADRVSVVGGRLSLSSPAGGPTRLIVEIPCQTIPVSA
ncbi:histidine kinase [Actinoplanes cyaneus]|uniref:histidine kinase n=1 Tax=Actinoplanes cyaneus TaxID=52696 RepID=A0A919IRA9_9ACTN|nr:sensor histidine kinase [Actinoplanes cyaneus]GID69596.1 histidine kinase [Actinoplanes cyaneus]